MNTYERVTQLIVDKLKAGVVPWQRPWTSGHAPTNLSTLKPYRGVNVLLTSMQGFASPYWMTFNQARDLGATVRKGEKGTPIVYFSKIEREEDNGDVTKYPLLRCYTVFNVAQLDNLRLKRELLYPVAHNVGSIDTAQRLVDGVSQWPSPVSICHGGDRAYYQPLIDKVTVPERDVFKSAEHYYATVFHEMGHASGHTSRLNRKELMELNPFGSHDYSREELVAEMCSAFLCAEAGIEAPVIDNAASYIAAWLKRLQDDSRFIVVAAARAQKAADYVLGRAAVTSETNQTA